MVGSASRAREPRTRSGTRREGSGAVAAPVTPNTRYLRRARSRSWSVSFPCTQAPPPVTTTDRIPKPKSTSFSFKGFKTRPRSASRGDRRRNCPTGRWCRAPREAGDLSTQCVVKLSGRSHYCGDRNIAWAGPQDELGAGYGPASERLRDEVGELLEKLGAVLRGHQGDAIAQLHRGFPI